MDTCPNNHPVLPRQWFCPLCGARLGEGSTPAEQPGSGRDLGLSPASSSSVRGRAHTLPLSIPRRRGGPSTRTVLIVVGGVVVSAALLAVSLVLWGGGSPDLRGPLASSGEPASDHDGAAQVSAGGHPNEFKFESMDEQAVLAMLQEYLQLYDAGDYVHASVHISSRVEQECGGPTALTFALAQNHEIEGIDYGAKEVHASTDDPQKADVTMVEMYGGRSYRLVLGLAFISERGEWKLDDLYPLGAGAFCEPG